MLGAEIHWSGDTTWIGKILERTDPADLERCVFSPFERWVTDWRIPELYRRKGRIGGEGIAWAALSKWTLASKGTSKYGEGSAAAGSSSLMPLVSSGLKMMKSYAITIARVGRLDWIMTLSNLARSTSKWSPGFDYPSALHCGWDEYTVRPRADGPGFLAWRVKQGTVIGGSMGRVGTGDTLRSSGVTSSFALSMTRGKRPKAQAQMVRADWMRAKETHPKGSPPRPHIMFINFDAQKLGLATIRFVLFAERPDPGSQGFARAA
jgi:hypothetical protein